MKHTNEKTSKNTIYKRLFSAGLCVFTLTSLTAQSVTVYRTTGSGSEKLEKKKNINFVKKKDGGSIVNIDSNVKYQSMDGFGASMTGSSAYLMNKLSKTRKENLLNSLFTSSGIKLSFVRHSIGSSDFSLGNYTYHDPGKTFSISKDRAAVIPMLKAAKRKNKQLKILGTPWTAPAWMKDNNSMFEGELKDDHLDDFALYLVRYLKAFKKDGLPIYAITMQNEPLHVTSSYPSMKMYWPQQSNLLKYHLGPLMAKEKVNSTKVLLYDHNWDDTGYAKSILDIKDSKKYAAGTAFHGYAGSVGAQTTLRNYHKDRGIWFTELSGGDWSTNFGNNLDYYAKNIIIGSVRNWSKSVLFWNLALDEKDGPQNGGCSNCRGVVTIKKDGSFTKEIEYYALGHLSKFVAPGAKRIKSDNRGDIITVAFRNPDGRLILVAYNKSTKSKTFKGRTGDKEFKYAMPGRSLVTFKWRPSSSKELINDFSESNQGVINSNANASFIYPSPIKDSFTVDLTSVGLEKATLSIIDITGQVISEYRLVDEITKLNLPDSTASGIHIALLEGENVSKFMKIAVD